MSPKFLCVRALTYCHGLSYAVAMNEAAVIPMPDRTPDSIVGVNVRYLMNDRRIDQPSLARQMGIDQSTLSLKLSGKRKWTVSELLAVSKTLNASIDWLTVRHDAPPAGGGSNLHGVTPIRPRTLGLVGPEGFEPPTSTVESRDLAPVLPFKRKAV